jgi:recombinational DNA repair protein (RecF pathway)
LSEACIAFHRGRSLDVIAQVQTIRSHWSDLVRPDALAAASLVAELVDLFCEPDLPMDEIYTLLIGVSAAIAGDTQPARLIPRFQLRLLHALGLAPVLDACIRCGEAFGDEGAWVDQDAGGLGCERCYGVRGDTHALAREDIANFRALGSARSAGRAAALTATPKVARAVDDLVTFHLGRRPKARALLDAFERDVWR